LSGPKIVVVCTAGVCRSPFAAAVLRHRLERHGVQADVRAVGLQARGRSVDRRSAAALDELGIALPSEPAGRLDASVRDADLVIGMGRQHIREAVVLDRDLFPRAFTLRELVRRGETLGPRQRGQSLRDWLAQLHEGRTAATLLEASSSDDVADPFGFDEAGYSSTTDELVTLVDRLVELAWLAGRADSHSSASSTVHDWHRVGQDAGQGAVLLAIDAEIGDLEGALYSALSDRGFVVRPVGGRKAANGSVEQALAAARTVAAGDAEIAICVSATGIPSAVAANRIRTVRAAVLHDVTTARLARRLGVNVVCIGVDIVTTGVAVEIVSSFLDVPAHDTLSGPDRVILDRLGDG
jgi:protein-tyrosine-phosphatase/ribose 5-phosphate isomerase RpiB